MTELEQLGQEPPRDGPPAAVRLTSVGKAFGWGPQRRTVLARLDLQLPQGGCLGLVGESGSGKSTLGKIVTGIYRFDAGRLDVMGYTLTPGAPRPAALRDQVCYIPQNPYASFDPRKTIGQSMAEALNPRSMSVARNRDKITDWLSRVSLPGDAISRYPHEFSGGQRQRIAIARALSTRPEVVVADEVTSALDVSVQAEVLALLEELRRETSFSMLLISHDLTVVRGVCTDVAVMRAGQIVETGPTGQVLSSPGHPYTQQLLSSIPGAPGFSLTEDSAS